MVQPKPRTSDLRPDRREHLLVVLAPGLKQSAKSVLGRHVALEGAEDYMPPSPRRATHNDSSPETPGWFIRESVTRQGRRRRRARSGPVGSEDVVRDGTWVVGEDIVPGNY
jgi:hypothetical protein